VTLRIGSTPVSGCVGYESGLSNFFWDSDLSGGFGFIDSCVSYGAAGNGLLIGSSASSTLTVTNCIFLDNDDYGIDMGSTPASAGVTLINNTYYGNSTSASRLSTRAAETEIGDLYTDPELVDPANGDFRLSQGSPSQVDNARGWSRGVGEEVNTSSGGGGIVGYGHA